MNDNRTPIEKIKAYFSVKEYISAEDQLDLQQKFGISNDDLKNCLGLIRKKNLF